MVTILIPRDIYESLYEWTGKEYEISGKLVGEWLDEGTFQVRDYGVTGIGVGASESDPELERALNKQIEELKKINYFTDSIDFHTHNVYLGKREWQSGFSDDYNLQPGYNDVASACEEALKQRKISPNSLARESYYHVLFVPNPPRGKLVRTLETYVDDDGVVKKEFDSIDVRIGGESKELFDFDSEAKLTNYGSLVERRLESLIGI